MTTGRNFDEVLRVHRLASADGEAQGRDTGQLEPGRRRHHRRLGERRGGEGEVSGGLEVAEAVHPDRAAAGLILDQVDVPIVLAPLGGGPSTPELAAAVSNAGGFGFLASAYLDGEATAACVERTRGLTDWPFGVNVFAPVPVPPSRKPLGRTPRGLPTGQRRAASSTPPLGTPTTIRRKGRPPRIGGRRGSVVRVWLPGSGGDRTPPSRRLEGLGHRDTPGESDLALEAGADALVDQEEATTAYPEIHYLTAPMRKAGREAGDAEVINLWAGEAHSLGREIPAARLVRELAADAARAAAAAATRLAT